MSRWYMNNLSQTKNGDFSCKCFGCSQIRLTRIWQSIRAMHCHLSFSVPSINCCPLNFAKVIYEAVGEKYWTKHVVDGHCHLKYRNKAYDFPLSVQEKSKQELWKQEKTRRNWSSKKNQREIVAKSKKRVRNNLERR